jgi:hypothetical protein
VRCSIQLSYETIVFERETIYRLRFQSAKIIILQKKSKEKPSK